MNNPFAFNERVKRIIEYIEQPLMSLVAEAEETLMVLRDVEIAPMEALIKNLRMAQAELVKLEKIFNDKRPDVFHVVKFVQEAIDRHNYEDLYTILDRMNSEFRNKIFNSFVGVPGEIGGDDPHTTTYLHMAVGDAYATGKYDILFAVLEQTKEDHRSLKDSNDETPMDLAKRLEKEELIHILETYNCY